MDIEVTPQPIDLTQPPGESDADESPLAAHEEQFGPPKPVQDDTELETRPRHKAISQRAKTTDLEDIAAFTKRLREAEEAIPIERKAGESDRVYNLRRRAEIAELAKTYKTTPAPEPTPVVEKPKPTPAPAVGAAFSEAEPTLDQFADKDDTYGAWVRAVAAYDRRKERWEEQQHAAQKDSEAAAVARVEQDKQAIAAHQTRMAAFAKQTPDFQAKTAALMDRTLPMSLLKAIATHDNGPTFVYYLAQHPDDLDDLFLAASGRSADDDDFVATLQRRLQKHVQAGTTGSAAIAKPITPAPRPPNPVRTGPITSGPDLPGDESSLAEHEKAFGPKRRR